MGQQNAGGYGVKERKEGRKEGGKEGGKKGEGRVWIDTEGSEVMERGGKKD